MKTSIRRSRLSATAIGRAASTAIPAILGKPIFVNGVPFTITGVAAPRFNGVESGGGTATDLWLPLQNSASLNAWGIPATPTNTLYASPNWYNLMLMARLKPGLTADQAIAQATATLRPRRL